MRKAKIVAPTLIDAQTDFAIAQDVINERVRQDERWGLADHPDGTGGPMRRQLADNARVFSQDAFARGIGTWQHILTEEVAEAFAETDPTPLRAELAQVAATAQAWMAALDRRTVVIQ